MPTNENKVQFNLKNVHYAVLTPGSTPAWGTPVAVPGAVSLSLDPQGDIKPFYADGVNYYQSIANNGYSGDLEMARYPDSMMADVWGMTVDATDMVIVEDATVEPKPFALLYQIDGDTSNQLYCLYNCIGARPGIGSSTTSDSKEPNTYKSSITASPLTDGSVMARTTKDTTDTVKSGWFTSVWRKAAV